ncbi:hypothetical protein [Nodularia spumigena]|uniref:hypothetical protein n=1 Tax=Nodularia spumigena TaxID=70799 RepID=UPI00232FB653|nr:hypothetical protein [Nodularia spumigena]MDB9356688.1 hypothetical protein [Nodularia spumigena CS-587/03]MDB9316185.1 hypothetical protein [Nodularia spumigena CS-590/01A]MDB9321608.1 hypothetical protein [Nodularia spumigena CS-591/07A]MDB9327464.1 hypothetical protein [Nodularia spumigena CS-590/02]MDB9331165.1 hypothetical protein [Nodularia spumigena CS-591/04]
MNDIGEYFRKFCGMFSDSSRNEKNPTYSEPRTQKPTSKTLVLVINSLNLDLIQFLQRQGKIESDDCDQLYRATRCLWLGSKTDLSPKLNEYTHFQAKEESEYDVYLITITLDEEVSGFERNADQMARIYAFRRLASLPVKVSERLTVEVYENTNVYSC